MLYARGLIGVPPEDSSEKPTIVHYALGYHREPHELGIDNGCIDRVRLRVNNELVCDYDFGWKMKPTCRAAEVALEILLYEYNGGSTNEE